MNSVMILSESTSLTFIGCVFEEACSWVMVIGFDNNFPDLLKGKRKPVSLFGENFWYY